ncbi:hypothetical protein KUTeg_016322 [Tegillarca granosa]|uniref:Uncharacterized protein n=1 Tax=Tegillarca granosa TaxID=220873 RepID=A0ABQ9EPB7_TEGGR|nr:hypothetical protein KUTeg_016322 [Tegillarca granosa]
MKCLILDQVNTVNKRKQAETRHWQVNFYENLQLETNDNFRLLFLKETIKNLTNLVSPMQQKQFETIKGVGYWSLEISVHLKYVHSLANNKIVEYRYFLVQNDTNTSYNRCTYISGFIGNVEHDVFSNGNNFKQTSGQNSESDTSEIPVEKGRLIIIHLTLIIRNYWTIKTRKDGFKFSLLCSILFAEYQAPHVFPDPVSLAFFGYNVLHKFMCTFVVVTILMYFRR